MAQPTMSIWYKARR